jgi:hypothetical protein
MATEPMPAGVMDTLLKYKSVTNSAEYTKQPFAKVWTEVAGARPDIRSQRPGDHASTRMATSCAPAVRPLRWTP